MPEPLVFDSEGALKRVDDDRELYAELFAMFWEEYPQMLQSLKEAQQKSDGKKIRETAHSMKSALGNIGAMKSHALAQVLETNGHQGRLEMIETNIKNLEEEIAKFKSAVEAWMK